MEIKFLDDCRTDIQGKSLAYIKYLVQLAKMRLSFFHELLDLMKLAVQSSSLVDLKIEFIMQEIEFRQHVIEIVGFGLLSSEEGSALTREIHCHE